MLRTFPPADSPGTWTGIAHSGNAAKLEQVTNETTRPKKNKKKERGKRNRGGFFVGRKVLRPAGAMSDGLSAQAQQVVKAARWAGGRSPEKRPEAVVGVQRDTHHQYEPEANDRTKPHTTRARKRNTPFHSPPD